MMYGFFQDDQLAICFVFKFEVVSVLSLFAIIKYASTIASKGFKTAGHIPSLIMNTDCLEL